MKRKLPWHVAALLAAPLLVAQGCAADLQCDEHHVAVQIGAGLTSKLPSE